MALVAARHAYPGAEDTGDRKIVLEEIASDKTNGHTWMTDMGTAMDYTEWCIFETCSKEKQTGGNCLIPECLVGGIHYMIWDDPLPNELLEKLFGYAGWSRP